MGCSRAGATEQAYTTPDGQQSGIMTGHAYSLNDVFEIEREDRPQKPKSRILRVRNPWGRGEWRGKWSDESDEIENHKEALEQYIAELEGDERFELGDRADGTFLINYKNWRSCYNRVFVVNDFPDEWSAIRFRSEWTE